MQLEQPSNRARAVESSRPDEKTTGRVARRIVEPRTRRHRCWLPVTVRSARGIYEDELLINGRNQAAAVAKARGAHNGSQWANRSGTCRAPATHAAAENINPDEGAVSIVPEWTLGEFDTGGHSDSPLHETCMFHHSFADADSEA